jgi:hypothetical protein
VITRNRLSTCSAAAVRSLRSRKRRTDVPLQGPTDGTAHQPTRRTTRARCSTGGRATRSRWPQIGRCACGVRGDDADQPPALVVGTCPVRPLALSADVSQVRKRPGRVAAPGRSARRPVPYRLAASRDALVVCVQGFPHRGGRVTCCPDRDRLGYRRPRPLCIRRCCTAGMAVDASLRKPRGCSRSLCIGRCRSRRRFLPGLDWPSGAISFRSWVEDRFPDSHPLNLQ